MNQPTSKTKPARLLKEGDIVQYEGGTRRTVIGRTAVKTGGWAGSVRVTFAENGAYAYFTASETVTLA